MQMIIDFENMSSADLEDLKNKPFYVRVWATWCGHCQRMRAGTPQLSKHTGDGIAVIDIEEKMLKHIMKKHPTDHFTRLFIQEVTGYPTVYYHNPSFAECRKVSASSPFATQLNDVGLAEMMKAFMPAARR